MIRFGVVSILLCFLLQGCVTNKTLTYFEDVERMSVDESGSDFNLKPNDLLFVKITSSSAEVNRYFGSSKEQENGMFQNLDISPSLYVNSFSISDSGFIYLPIVGKINVAEQTIENATLTIKNSLKSYVKTDVQVVVKLVNYSFTVLGEVNNQGRFYINEDAINLVEAIGIGGGINTYAESKEVNVIRTVQGETRSLVVDLDSPEALTCMIHPNDVVYIKPMKKGAQKQNLIQ